VSSFPDTSRPIRAADALCRLREVEDRQAQGRFHCKQMEIQKLKGEIANLEKRRGSVLRRRSGHVLRERLLLDALMKIALERGRQLEALNLQAGVLLSDYRDARSRKDAAGTLRKRRRAEQEAQVARRAEEFTADLLASRRLRERIRLGETEE
jgi:hypothetical protein